MGLALRDRDGRVTPSLSVTILGAELIERSPDANLEKRGLAIDSANCWRNSEAPWGKASLSLPKISSG
jgi:hypothetical protein